MAFVSVIKAFVLVIRMGLSSSELLASPICSVIAMFDGAASRFVNLYESTDGLMLFRVESIERRGWAGGSTLY